MCDSSSFLLTEIAIFTVGKTDMLMKQLLHLWVFSAWYIPASLLEKLKFKTSITCICSIPFCPFTRTWIYTEIPAAVLTSTN